MSIAFAVTKFGAAQSQYPDEKLITKPAFTILAHPQLSTSEDAFECRPNVRDVVFAQQAIMSCGCDRIVRTWDPVNGASDRVFPDLRQQVFCINHSDDYKVLARGGRFFFWEPRTNTGAGIELPRTEGCVILVDLGFGRTIGSLITERGTVASISFAAGNRLIALGTDVGSCELWRAEGFDDVSKLTRVRTLNHGDEGVIHAKFLVDGRSLVTGDSSVVKIWDAVTGELKQNLEGRAPVAVSADGRYLAFYGKERYGSVVLFDLQLNARASVLEPDMTKLRCIERNAFLWDGGLAFTPNCCFLAQGHSRLVTIWDVRKRASVAVIDAHPEKKGPVLHLSFSPNGMRLATADSTSPEIRIWDAKDFSK